MANKKENRRLVYLDDLKEYKMAKGDPDVWGWNLHDASGDNIGVVSGLIVDPANERVVYLDVDIREDIISPDHDPFDARHFDGIHEFQDKKGDIHMIVPVGVAHVDHVNKKVVADGIDQGALRNYPSYRYYEKMFQLHPEYERRIKEEYLRQKRYNEGRDSRLDDDTNKSEADYYKSDQFNEDQFYGRENPERGRRSE